MAEWRPIPGWPEYDVSDEGQVRRMAPAKGATPGKVLKPFPTGRDRQYRQVDLKRDNKRFPIQVHRLVLLAFVGPPPPGHECAHEDGDGSNNRLGNLSWKTRLANAADTTRHGTRAWGEKCGSAKLTEAQVEEIRRRYVDVPADGSNMLKHGRYAPIAGSITRLAEEYGCTRNTIRDIVRGTTWSH